MVDVVVLEGLHNTASLMDWSVELLKHRISNGIVDFVDDVEEGIGAASKDRHWH